MTDIGTFIAFHRKRKGFTQEYLGKLLGISGKVVSKWENGKSLPDILLLNNLSELLEITTTELLNSKDDIKH